MTKQSELGIGQSYFSHNTRKMVDYLDYMYDNQFIFNTAKPQEIFSYGTITYPFDIYTWGLTCGLIIGEFMLLLVMQNLWSRVTGKSNPQDYIFEGLLNLC